jgi:hypothetical protein
MKARKVIAVLLSAVVGGGLVATPTSVGILTFEEKIDIQSELHEVRSNAIKNFENKGFPTKKEESWKYTSLNGFCLFDFAGTMRIV